MNKTITNSIEELNIKIEDFGKRIEFLESGVNPNKTYSEKVLEHFISPVGLETIYKIAPGTENMIKEMDTAICDKVSDVVNDSSPEKITELVKETLSTSTIKSFSEKSISASNVMTGVSNFGKKWF